VHLLMNCSCLSLSSNQYLKSSNFIVLEYAAQIFAFFLFRMDELPFLKKWPGVYGYGFHLQKLSTWDYLVSDILSASC